MSALNCTQKVNFAYYDIEPTEHDTIPPPSPPLDERVDDYAQTEAPCSPLTDLPSSPSPEPDPEQSQSPSPEYIVTQVSTTSDGGGPRRSSRTLDSKRAATAAPEDIPPPKRQKKAIGKASLEDRKRQSGSEPSQSGVESHTDVIRSASPLTSI